MTELDLRSAATPPSGGDTPLLEVRDLQKHFPIHKGLLQRTVGHVRAVDGVSFDIARGSTLALVGESGCGKTTTGRVILRLIEATGGNVRFDGTDLASLDKHQLRELRKRIQIIFQDPYSSLDPRMTAADIVGEGLEIHGIATGQAQLDRVADLLERVGLSRRDLRKFPHQFSGGQRQRIGVARALATSPDLIVCDEAVSALDVSVQAQVLNLLKDLQAELGVSYLFITHDLNVVRYIADRVAVMYLGQIVELADTEQLFTDPQHPYTKSLLSAVPILDPDVARSSKRRHLQGDVPSPSNPPPGCRFHTRCPEAVDACARHDPGVVTLSDGRMARECAVYLPQAYGLTPDEFRAQPKRNAADFADTGAVT
ncbi:MAG: ABC transporter ATP-binding protein [Acidimicrobiales bacterium]